MDDGGGGEGPGSLQSQRVFHGSDSQSNECLSLGDALWLTGSSGSWWQVPVGASDKGVPKTPMRRHRMFCKAGHCTVDGQRMGRR